MAAHLPQLQQPAALIRSVKSTPAKVSLAQRIAARTDAGTWRPMAGRIQIRTEHEHPDDTPAGPEIRRCIDLLRRTGFAGSRLTVGASGNCPVQEVVPALMAARPLLSSA